MVKHRRYSDKPKEDSTQKAEKTEFQNQEISSEKTSLDLKSLLLSGTKYAYIIGAVALLSGIFTPLTLGCLLYTSPSPRDRQKSRMPSSA